jgi:hypothetical protein
MDLHPGDRVSVVGPATLPCVWYGPNHSIDDPDAVVGRRALVIAVWRDWVAVSVEGGDNTWWIAPDHLELLR